MRPWSNIESQLGTGYGWVGVGFHSLSRFQDQAARWRRSFVPAVRRAAAAPSGAGEDDSTRVLPRTPAQRKAKIMTLVVHCNILGRSTTEEAETSEINGFKYDVCLLIGAKG